MKLAHSILLPVVSEQFHKWCVRLASKKATADPSTPSRVPCTPRRERARSLRMTTRGLKLRNSNLGAAFVFMVLCLYAPLVVAAQPTRADAEKDPVLAAMLTELDRSMAHLQLPGFAKPFFIQYRIEEVDDFETKAEFGASEGAGRVRQRVARVTVRVGDYKTDSSGGRGDGSVELTSLDDDPIALRSALWQATDQAYKNALSAYAQKQAALKQVQTPPQADDFSQEKPIVSLGAHRSRCRLMRTLGLRVWRG